MPRVDALLATTRDDDRGFHGLRIQNSESRIQKKRITFDPS
jgi:hypothetical protein